jgi:hypothetical protein
MKYDTDKLLMKDDGIKKGLKKYFDKLFNEENESITVESWTTHLLTLTSNLIGEFKSMR